MGRELMYSPPQCPMQYPMGCGDQMLGGPSPYETTASDYDGTNDDARRGADLTGNAVAKKGIISFIFRLDGGDGVNQGLYYVDSGQNLFILRRDTNTIRVFVRRNDTGVGVIDFTTAATWTAGATHRTLLLEWDTSSATTTNNYVALYVDDVDVTAGATFSIGSANDLPNVDVRCTGGNHWIAVHNSGTLRYNGCLSELFIHYGANAGIKTEANRRKFFDASNKPVDKGADGSTPLGVQPLVYAPNGDPSDNKGSGGNFSITGALTACSSSPTD